MIGVSISTFFKNKRTVMNANLELVCFIIILLLLLHIALLHYLLFENVMWWYHSLYLFHRWYPLKNGYHGKLDMMFLTWWFQLPLNKWCKAVKAFTHNTTFNAKQCMWLILRNLLTQKSKCCLCTHMIHKQKIVGMDVSFSILSSIYFGGGGWMLSSVC